MFFLSRLFDALSMNIRQFSLSLLVYYLTGSAAWLGYLTLARAIPLLFFSPVTGALADRLEKKTLIVWASVADVVIAAIIGISLTTGYLSPVNPGSWIFLVFMSFCDGISTIFKGPSSDAMVIEIVGEKLITNAIAINQAGQNTLRLLGPVLAGVAIDHWGYEPSFYVMAVFYALALVFMLFVPYTGKGNTRIGGYPRCICLHQKRAEYPLRSHRGSVYGVFLYALHGAHACLPGCTARRSHATGCFAIHERPGFHYRLYFPGRDAFQ